MALTNAQIIALACADAKVPGYTVYAGQLYNMILDELCDTYDFDITRKTTTITLVADNGSGNGAGPYNLPADYLRADRDDVFYTINGVPYCLIPIDVSEYDNLVLQPGIANYPEAYATFMENSPPTIKVWPPSSGAYPLTVRYRAKMASITTPESSSASPWFVFTAYLRTRLAGELMKMTDDTRWQDFLGTGDSGAQGMLTRYLKLKDDKSTRTATVQLDRRRFGNNFSRLANTKLIGW